MKKIVCLLSVLIIGQITFCQTRILKMNEWTEYSKCVEGCGVGKYKIDGDTTINDIEYRKITINGNLEGAVRETLDSLVYFYSISYKQEFLLYDFSWNIGKQIKSVDITGEIDKLEYVYATIDKIDTIALENGEKWPYITTSLGTKCIQGIGDTEGFLCHIDLARPDCEINHKLWCALGSGIDGKASLLYKDEQCNDCYICNEKLAIGELNNNTNISPNPVKDILTLTLPTSNNEIRIFDLQGKLLLQQNVGKTAEINVLSLKAGTYMLVVNDTENITFIKQ
ncbi:MAG: T9SS type A sorting domain-containing protein [Bacteroidales bacterium]|nr:T9SS type A sorting domain-containing protein [Bacteroidales bacterium]